MAVQLTSMAYLKRIASESINQSMESTQMESIRSQCEYFRIKIASTCVIRREVNSCKSNVGALKRKA